MHTSNNTFFIVTARLWSNAISPFCSSSPIDPRTVTVIRTDPHTSQFLRFGDFNLLQHRKTGQKNFLKSVQLTPDNVAKRRKIQTFISNRYYFWSSSWCDCNPSFTLWPTAPPQQHFQLMFPVYHKGIMGPLVNSKQIRVSCMC